MAKKRILICSSYFDEHTHGPVREHLLHAGFEVITYQIDRVMRAEQRLCLIVAPDGSFGASCDGVPISPGEIDAAWYWKVANFAVPHAESNLSKQLTMVNEITQYNNSVWSLYSDERWLSAPRRIQWADRKLVQLKVASRLGFTAPETLITNDWDDVLAFHERMGTDLIVKMFKGVIGDQNTVRAMYTTVLDRSKILNLRSRTASFPGIFQPFVPKAREWRVTVVGDEVFAGAIYAGEEAKNDWRQLQQTASVAFRSDRFDGATADLCRAYLKEFGLGIGSFDFVERPDGSLVFLECNPSGQFGFLEQLLGLPISASVAARLGTIAAGQLVDKQISL
jgi:glutathione synthase/RimK-type ligase-like ATP-grasp enzyme